MPELKNNLIENSFFESFSYCKISKKNTFLLAISGGLDSMVLLDLFQKSQFKFTVAHVNFGLRGIDSDLDEKLVEDFCKKNHITYFCKKVEAIEFKKNRNSTQMIARKIRYDYFAQLRKTNKIDYLVTAHHQNDQIETFFIQLFRGAGIKGLSGMNLLKDEVFRPLLNVSREQILSYATQNQIVWREDASNFKTDYLRNKIRLELLPKMKETYELYDQQILKSVGFIQEIDEILKKEVEKICKKGLKKYHKKTKTYFYKLNKIKKLSNTLLHYFFSKYDGIPSNEISKFLNSEVGTKFENEKYIFWIDYEFLIIEPNKPHSTEIIQILTPNVEISQPIKLKFQVLESMDANGVAWFDASKLVFPLKIRMWNTNDNFHPLNFNGTKKISKYLKDNKISAYFRQFIYVLTDANNQIVWIVNHRADDRFKVTEHTKHIVNVWK